ncbi:hypothetical protein ACFWIW_28090 [Amycolatopsis sp. NPDC058340]|uniref:hypothetical protein n=1 Tax=Amycolatopsis sp. NPDC058340 TaxID=3346453 RepID=UPI00365B0985
MIAASRLEQPLVRPDYRGALNVVADVDTLNLLNTQLMYGCLLTTGRVADAVTEGRLPGNNLRKLILTDDFNPQLDIVTGIFARPSEAQRCADDHPLNALWNAFAAASPAQANA